MKNKIFFLTVGLIFVVGCQSAPKTDEEFTEETDLELIRCTRSVDQDDLTANLNYTAYYKGEYLKILYSSEAVTSDNNETLEEYKSAYERINESYKGLDGYESEVIKKDNTVTKETLIKYDIVDTNRLLEIEGSSDNVINSDGTVLVKEWKELAEKFGAVCDDIK